mgnify:FL=1
MTPHPVDALACMIILRAIMDARKGDTEAAEWLTSTGLDLLSAMEIHASREQLLSANIKRVRRFVRRRDLIMR